MGGSHTTLSRAVRELGGNMRIPEPVSIMTASLSAGDAIGNHIITLKRLLEREDVDVQLYADHVAPQYIGIARDSAEYQGGDGTLWFHYSIYADNLAQIEKPADFKIIDYHGVSPPELVKDYDAHLTDLCTRGVDALPDYTQAFDLSIVHSEYTRQELTDLGYKRPYKLPYVVDTSRFSGAEDPTLSAWLERLPYVLFVGRIVPQKDILAMLDVFQYLHQLRPSAVLVLVGGRHLARRYQAEIDQRIDHYRLKERVLFTGQINSPEMLTSLYKHAHFTLITSEWESFCVPIVESMTFGTPLVVNNVPPLPEVMGQAGIVIDKRNPRAAAREIEELWQHDTRYAALVRACRERAHAFTDTALADELMQLFSQVFGDS